MSKTYYLLDDLIEKTGLKKNVISERMGVDYSTFYKWRVDPTTMNIDNIEKLAEVLGVSFLDIYNIIKKFKKEVDLIAT